MARPLKIAWKHTEEELYELYRREKDADLARRWQALWLLRRGERLIRVKAVLGVMHTTIQRWVRWYEAGGIAEVARRKSGNRKTHRQAWTVEQEAKLKEAVSEGRFRTVGEAVRWCAEVLGIEVSEGKVYYWFRRWGYRKKVPRPLAQKADVEAQEVWKKKAFWKRSVRRV